MRRHARLLGAALALSNAACYRYVAVPEPAPGAELRVRLSDEGTRDLTATLGTPASVVEGRLLARENGALRLAVAAVRGARGPAQPWEGEQSVLVPATAYRAVQQRTLSRQRTGLLVGGAALAAALLVAQVAGSGGEGGGAGAPPPGGAAP